MPKFKKKPVVVDAVQWFKDGDHPSVFIATEEVSSNCFDEPPNTRLLYPVIKTLEGEMRVSKGDYIITGVEGEVYPVKPSIFEKTYEEVFDNMYNGKIRIRPSHPRANAHVKDLRVEVDKKSASESDEHILEVEPYIHRWHIEALMLKETKKSYIEGYKAGVDRGYGIESEVEDE